MHRVGDALSEQLTLDSTEFASLVNTAAAHFNGPAYFKDENDFYHTIDENYAVEIVDGKSAIVFTGEIVLET
jgi:hypothetical protein